MREALYSSELPIATEHCGIPVRTFVLEPAENPTSNSNVLDNLIKFGKDSGCIDENNFCINDRFLVLVMDQAIFKRAMDLKNSKEYREKLKWLIPFPGQFHLNWEMARVIVAMFSGAGLFQMASILGVNFLDHFKGATEYRATIRILFMIWLAATSSLAEILEYNIERNDNSSEINNNNFVRVGENDGVYLLKGDEWPIIIELHPKKDFLKLLYLLHIWIGVLISHRTGIRIGSFTLQMEAVEAFGPLFEGLGKNLYSILSCQLMGMIKSKDSLEATKITEIVKNHASGNGGKIFNTCQLLALDELLEYLGVGRVKQTFHGRAPTDSSLKEHMLTFSSEAELLEGYINVLSRDPITGGGPESFLARARNAGVLKLKKQLIEAYNFQKPFEHSLFYGSLVGQKGYIQELFNLYNSSLTRMDHRAWHYYFRASELASLTTKQRKDISKGARSKSISVHMSGGSAVNKISRSKKNSSLEVQLKARLAEMARLAAEGNSEEVHRLAKLTERQLYKFPAALFDPITGWPNKADKSLVVKKVFTTFPRVIYPDSEEFIGLFMAFDMNIYLMSLGKRVFQDEYSLVKHIFNDLCLSNFVKGAKVIMLIFDKRGEVPVTKGLEQRARDNKVKGVGNPDNYNRWKEGDSISMALFNSKREYQNKLINLICECLIKNLEFRPANDERIVLDWAHSKFNEFYSPYLISKEGVKVCDELRNLYGEADMMPCLALNAYQSDFFQKGSWVFNINDSDIFPWALCSILSPSVP